LNASDSSSMEFWSNATDIYSTLCRVDRDFWVRHINELVSTVSEACQWLVELLSSDKGPTYLKYVMKQCTMSLCCCAQVTVIITVIYSTILAVQSGHSIIR